jgi:hypothetical protein
MIIRMENAESLSLAKMEALLETSQEVQFAGKGRAHEGLSGPATRRILEREAVEYGHREYWSPWPWWVLVVKHKIAVLGRQKGPPSDCPISGSLFDWKMLSSASCICKSENGRISNVARSFRLS